MKTTLSLTAILLSLQFSFVAPAADEKDDWPMWRRNPARTGRTGLALPDPLRLQWTRTLPPLIPAYRNSRLQFDRGYEPVVAGKTLFVASSWNDSIRAYDTETGEEKWRFTTEGPVRFAPVVWRERVFVASDDGRLYCLDAAKGKPLWVFQAVPSNRKVLGNGRLISTWPVRGGPVLADGKVYFAAGVWPFEGVFVYALDAETGSVAWLNDRTGNIYGDQPHAAEAIGGVTPQGSRRDLGSKPRFPGAHPNPVLVTVPGHVLIKLHEATAAEASALFGLRRHKPTSREPAFSLGREKLLTAPVWRSKVAGIAEPYPHVPLRRRPGRGAGEDPHNARGGRETVRRHRRGKASLFW